MTDSLGSIVHSLDSSEPAFARREWELRERIDELQSELTERVERERIRELELASQRHELEVRFAYNAMLEERLLDHTAQIGWLHQHCDGEAQRFEVEHQRVAVEHQRVVADLETRCAILAEELAAKHEQAHHLHLAVEAIREERDTVRFELNTERRRISYRVLSQSLAARVKRHRYLSALLRRAARVIS